MFVISQFILHKSKLCNFDNISTYAIASGLVVYVSIYLYLLFYNNEYLSLFNKFIIYIIGIDLLLSTFYFFNTSKTNESSTLNSISSQVNEIIQNNDNFQKPENMINIDSDSDIDADDQDQDSDFEVEMDECYETEDMYEGEDENEYEDNTNQNPNCFDDEYNQDNEDNEDKEDKEDNEDNIEQINTNENKITDAIEDNKNQEPAQQPQQDQKLNDILQNQKDDTKSLDLELSSEPVVKKRRGRKPNHLKMQMQ